MSLFSPYLLSSFLVYKSVSITGDGNPISATCQAGMYLLSCGMWNSQVTLADPHRSQMPIINQTCQCYARTPVICYAWCTSIPTILTVVGTPGVGQLKASCPLAGQLTGCCFWKNRAQPLYDWEIAKPLNNQTCTCNDPAGGMKCFASCITGIKNFELQKVSGNGAVQANCKIPTNTALGCGFDFRAGTTLDYFRAAYVYSEKGCNCVYGNGTNCYVICGEL